MLVYSMKKTGFIESYKTEYQDLFSFFETTGNREKFNYFIGNDGARESLFAFDRMFKTSCMFVEYENIDFDSEYTTISNSNTVTLKDDKTAFICHNGNHFTVALKGGEKFFYFGKADMHGQRSVYITDEPWKLAIVEQAKEIDSN